MECHVEDTPYRPPKVRGNRFQDVSYGSETLRKWVALCEDVQMYAFAIPCVIIARQVKCASLLETFQLDLSLVASKEARSRPSRHGG